jgi:hypothetical protein
MHESVKFLWAKKFGQEIAIYWEMTLCWHFCVEIHDVKSANTGVFISISARLLTLRKQDLA